MLVNLLPVLPGNCRLAEGFSRTANNARTPTLGSSAFKGRLLISASDSDTHPRSESFTSNVYHLKSTAYMWSAYHWPMELNYYLSSCFRENVDSSSRLTLMRNY